MHSHPLRRLSDDALEALRLDLCRRGSFQGTNTPGLAATRGTLRAVAAEQTRRAEAVRSGVPLSRVALSLAA